MKVTSPNFFEGQPIPTLYTCDGKNINPALVISDIPIDTVSLAISVDDPDSPTMDFNHWIVWDILPATLNIPEGWKPNEEVFGVNSFGQSGYGGPCPSVGQHRYIFTVFALDKLVDLPKEAKKFDFDRETKDHIIEVAQLMGVYKRK